MFRRLTHASSFFVDPLNLLVLFAYIDGHWIELHRETRDNFLVKLHYGNAG